mgnify:CR=1 FL=1
MDFSADPKIGPSPIHYDDSIDLSQCDREEIRFPAAIMPHGVMLVL